MGLVPAWLRLLPVLCLLLPASGTVVAADWYQVEAILFEYTAPNADDEWWYENPGLPSRHQTIQLIKGTADPVAGESPEPVDVADLMPYLALQKRDYRLGGVRRALELSGEYKPLLHVAWQQPGLDTRNLRAIHLDNTQFEKKTAVQDGQVAGEERDLPEYTAPKKEFDGIIRLRKSRFLHLDVDFAYFPELLEQPDLAYGPDASGRPRLATNYVRMAESRRVKLDELQYFDHPLFGVVIQVRKLEIME